MTNQPRKQPNAAHRLATCWPRDPWPAGPTNPSGSSEEGNDARRGAQAEEQFALLLEQYDESIRGAKSAHRPSASPLCAGTGRAEQLAAYQELLELLALLGTLSKTRSSWN
ncbi:MAG: hypothetical protein HYX69_23100 [Planctomycetia bacterium]|nr:hypothetical protein [Planctomycetia bacterium]